MDIELISAELRPRRPWEAVDLGISLGRRHIGKLLLFWVASVLPLIVILSALLWNHFQVLVLVIWWLKPLYDRVPLYYLSRALFGSAPTLREFLRILPRLWSRRVLDALILGRFSLARSIVLPIKELEGLKGGAYTSRRDALLRSSAGPGQWFTALCLGLEHFFAFALVLFATSAIPVVAPPDPVSYVQTLSELIVTGEFALDPLVVAGVLGAWIVSLTFVENLYVAGGFGLYLNARTELEGWDVELTFRRIANRIRRIRAGGVPALVVVGIGLALLAGTSGARAADPVTDPPGEVMETILADEDFRIHVETERVPVSDGSLGWLGSLSFLGAVGYILFWGVVAFLVVYIAMLLYRNRHYFMPGAGTAKEAVAAARARTVLGMEIGGDSLPDDIVAAARGAWQGGRKKEALSLLYRGAVSWLVESGRAPIRESDTEHDCLNHARLTEAARSKLGYLESLTGTWIGLAYGRSEPDDDEMERLLAAWPFKPGVNDG